MPAAIRRHPQPPMQDTTVTPSHSHTRRQVAFVALATVVLLAPFAGKAFHIDDTLFLAMARQIQGHPLDPYGFDINWADRSAPAWLMIENPPLASYFIALAAYLVGWSETALHLIFLIPAITAILGAFFLAKRFCGSPLTAALALLLTPVFLLSGTMLMCDVIMLAFWLWAVVLWMRGEDTRRLAPFVGSGILISLAAMTKYFGIALVPLLLVYSVAHWRRIGWRVTVLLIPLAVMAAWELATKYAYGRGLIFDAATYSQFYRTAVGATTALKLLVGLSFTGGCLAVVLCHAPVLWSRKVLLIGVAMAVAGALAISRIPAIGAFPLRGLGGIHWSPVIQISILVVGGIGVIGLAVSDLLRTRNAESLLLFTWVGGTFIFAGVLNWSVNGRSILPMAPAVCILLVRRMERRMGRLPAYTSPRFLVPLAVAGALAMSVTYADYTLANCARTGARLSGHIARDAATFWFQGHWGFHYYAEQEGARAMDMFESTLYPGDLVAYPENASDLIPLPDDAVAVAEMVTCRPCAWLSTMHRDLGAGFFSDAWGPLPFAFGNVPAERFNVLLVRRQCSPPLSAVGRMALGTESIQEGKAKEAAEHFTEALRYEPDAPDAHTMLGIALMMQGRFGEAIREHRRALGIRPDLGGVHSNLAVALFGKRRYAEAWNEVRLARKCGYEPPREFIEALSLFMPEPSK